jgi:protein-S-isoprenylcysteine O-methyltransferase Ste14
MLLALTPYQVAILGYTVLAVVGLVLFYYIIKTAVKSGTEDIVEELRKQNKVN